MPSERIRIGDDYYLLAAAVPAHGHHLVLNHGNSFAVVDDAGDVPFASFGPVGLFCNGTRFLDRFELRLNGGFPVVLSAAPTDDETELVTYLTNPDERRGGEVVVQRDTLAIERRKVLIDGALFETLHIKNYRVEPLEVVLSILFTADFADLFELRGVERAARGRITPPRVDGQRVSIDYIGLDEVARALELEFAPDLWRVGPDVAELKLRLAPGAEARARVTVHCRVGDRTAAPPDPASALMAVRSERQENSALFTTIVSSNAAFNEWINGAVRDLALLRAQQPCGAYVYAGIPWFATVFGRDGLITSLETLAFAPDMSVGTLRCLAALQGREYDAWREEEPGKILHELRFGEMAATGEIPFARYYGSIDATPLFIALLAGYGDRTGDLELVREMWPAANAAMDWILRRIDARGYLSYERRTPKGLINQGWKDSHEAVSHADGRLAEPPIALCEVQGYVYAALRGMASLARRLGEPSGAAAWDGEADVLRARFARDFWFADEGTYVLALDRHGQPCQVVSSNAGHCLISGIAEPAHAGHVVARLMRDDCFCGWGIRTLSTQARRYNPMSYHNGSVWPHDNALIGAGFARSGFRTRAAEILTALFEASFGLEDRRLPELFCGFPRSEREQPVPYPVACRPQAWAAGSVFLLLQAALGLTIDAWRRRVSFHQPVLPFWLDYVEIRGLRVRDARVDVRIVRGRKSAALEVVDRHGEVDIVVLK
ncbi:MAG: glycogen debranching N-terminal domain-containing protein [Candidatus Binatia bacterium]